MTMKVDPDATTITLTQLADALERHSLDTLQWDAWINGQLDRELEGVTDASERRKICGRHVWSHDFMTARRATLRLIGDAARRGDIEYVLGGVEPRGDDVYGPRDPGFA
jgi:hypothetical protein